MAGFAPEPKDLAKSRTMIGGVAAVASGGITIAANAISTATDGIVQPQDVTVVTSIIGELLGPSLIASVSPYISIASILFMMWARWDDARRKLR